MEKTIKVEFNEQSKAVVTSVKLEIKGEDINNDEVLEEVKDLFNKASAYSALKTMSKIEGR